MVSSSPTPSISISPSRKNLLGTIDGDNRPNGQIMVSDIPQCSPLSGNEKAYFDGDFLGDDDDKDDDNECCPICYEDFLPSSSPKTAVSAREEDTEVATISTVGECSCCFDDDNENCRQDICDMGIDANIQIDAAQITLSNGGHPEEKTRLSHPKWSKGNDKNCHHHHHHHHQHRRIPCDPREKVIIPGCAHTICRGCLKDHCSYSISIRDLPIRCPNFSGDGSSLPCSVTLPVNLIRETLLMEDSTTTNPDWTKFQRLQRMLEDPSLIPCTRCDELISPEQGKSNQDETGDPNRIHCPACQHVFCRIHGDGHLGRDCSTQDDARRDQNPSEKAILELCKPCSHCGIPICKEDGCNHVVCPVCKDDMCFKCGTHKDLVSKSRTVRSCKACQGSYFDHRYIWRHRLGVLAKLPLMLPIYLGYMATTLALVIATCGCFCCLGCGVRRSEKTKTKRQESPTVQEQNKRPNGSTKIVFMPLMAVREVMGMLCLPFVDLFRECRTPCCFCHNAPGLCEGRPADDDDDDDSYYEDYEVSESEHMEGDIENQIRAS